MVFFHFLPPCSCWSSLSWLPSAVDDMWTMTEEEIKERLETLSYLKIHPRDREENKYLLLLGERIYEESLGEKRKYIEAELHNYEKALNTYDTAVIEEAKKKFKEFLEEFKDFD